ncbi:MAG TPA: pyridoxal phosphate-dependent aminotransferase [Polyangiaceae bacterium]
MPTSLASRLKVIQPSATLAMNARAQEMKSRGIDVFTFGVGEPDFEPASYILDAANEAIAQKKSSKYTAVTGIAPLKEAICKASARRRGDAPKPENVTVTVGAKHALFNLALALYDAGDEVVMPAPYWVSYPEQVRIVGAEPVIVGTEEENGWRMTPDALERAITKKTKAVILCTPSNPTGAAYGEKDLRALCEVMEAHDAWLIVDEIYAELVYDGFVNVSASTIAKDMKRLKDRLIVIDGVSKSYAMTGWRIGWSIAPREVAKACDVVQGQSTTNPSAVAQYAAIAALNGPQDEVQKMRATFEKRRDAMVGGLNSLPGVKCRKPEGAFYAFADVRGLYGLEHGDVTIENDNDVAMFLLDKAHVASVAGGPFGAPGFLRLSYATSEDRIKAGIESMRKAIDTAKRAHGA